MPLFIVALACLAAATLIQILLPNYQGNTFDRLIDARVACVNATRSHPPTPPPPHASAAVSQWLLAPFSTAAAVVARAAGASVVESSDRADSFDDSCSEHRDAFLGYVSEYLVLSIGLGVLSGLRALCFQVVGRKIEVSMRGRLFRQILRQGECRPG